MLLPLLRENYSMVKVGEFNVLKVLRAVDFGFYLDDGSEGILLPKRFVPENLSHWRGNKGFCLP
ncbi:MAG: S1-like domain-containing RNA-binding protein [Segetibacter sp.]